MKQTRLIMGMPITVEILDTNVTKDTFTKVFDYFTFIDEKFSTYKSTSEITAINENKLQFSDYSPEMKDVFEKCLQTKNETNGYFEILHDGKYDPSGLVKGLSIYEASKIISNAGFKNYYVDAGGDIQVGGKNKEGKLWKVGIKNPYDETEIVKTVYLDNIGIATSGTYIRGQHIYNPKNNKIIEDVVSLSVIAENVYEADRFATAAFAMGLDGINFIEKLKGFEGYMIDKNKVATMTSGFEKYTHENN